MTQRIRKNDFHYCNFGICQIPHQAESGVEHTPLGSTLDSLYTGLLPRLANCLLISRQSHDFRFSNLLTSLNFYIISFFFPLDHHRLAFMAQIQGRRGSSFFFLFLYRQVLRIFFEIWFWINFKLFKIFTVLVAAFFRLF